MISSRQYLNHYLFTTVDLPEFCKENDAVFIYPVNQKADEILQVGPSGKLEMVSTKDMVGLKTRAMNARCYCGMLRKGVECMHCAVKMDKMFSHAIHWTYLKPLGNHLLQRLNPRIQ